MRTSCRTGRVIPFAFVLLLAAVHGWADDTSDVETFDNPAFESDAVGAELAMGVSDASFSGNPAGSLFDKWPDDLVVAPIPGRSPQLGWTLALTAGYFLTSKEEDSEVPPSVIGLYGLIAENGSNIYGVGGKFNLLDDRLRVTVGGGYADVRYRFYGIGRDEGDLGVDIDILQEGPAYFANARWRLFGQFYAGLGLLRGDVDSRLRFPLDSPSALFDPTLSLNVGAISIPLEIDTRDHEYFPRSGWQWQADTRFYRDAFGSDFETETFKLSVNHYLAVRENDALATRFVFRATGEDAPFFILSSFGGKTDLRGYPAGRYRDRMMYALQSEYRWHINDRWILTGFAGFGEVANTVSDFGRDLLPAAGIGARFVVSEKHRVSLSADLAVGDDGAEFYFGVGEAF